MSELINNDKQKRQALLKKLIKDLHDGKDKASVEAEFKKHFKDIETSEISDMEQALIKEGLPVEEVQRLCSVHASIFGGSIKDIHALDNQTEAGHPLTVLKDENDRIETLIKEEIERYIDQEGNTPLLMLNIALERLSEINKHYARKEQLFFPYLEKKGITGPPQVMWGVDDDIRKMIKDVRNALKNEDVKVSDVRDQIKQMIEEVKDMVFKENNILLPLLSKNLNLYNFIKISEASDEVGYFLTPPETQWHLDDNESKSKQFDVNLDDTTAKASHAVSFDAGSLLPKEVNAILNVLPLDLTFVDKNGHVKYFTQGKERIFDRPKTILGRHVNMCHPPKSVHIVEKIVERFESGESDHEDFWINMRGTMIHIRYFAVRDHDGNFLGTLEMTQNISPIRNLEGEKRLLDSE
ncbi:MAG: DUF438 domain-containing protein [Bacillota bacterium]